MSVYTNETRITLYKALSEHFGVYNVHTWHLVNDKVLTCPSSPTGFNTKQTYETFEEIYNSILKHFNGTKPKSPLALKQQVAWCMSVRVPADASQRSLQTRNRLAAYQAGFMRMTDIIKLEELEAAKALFDNSDDNS